MLRLGLFIALILAFASLSQGQNPTASPDLVIHIFRHGARAPLRDTYAADWDPVDLGQLTSIGMREHYLLGKTLTNQYPDILGQPFNLSRIYVRSSITDRSIASAESQLFGVYEGRGPALNTNPAYPPQRAYPPFQSPDVDQISQTLNNTQAIPGGFVAIVANTTSDEGGINLIEPSTVVCFNLLDNILENVLSDKSTQFWEDLSLTRQTLTSIGLPVSNPLSLGTLGDVLVCDYDDDRTLPGNIDPTSEVYRNVTFARNWYFVQAIWGAPQQRQLLSVPLFNYIFSYFDRKAAGTTDLEFIFLSTAETNLLHLLTTLNIVTADCLMDNYRAGLAGQPQPNPNCNYTEFASSILVEFYNNNGSPTVVFKYNNVAIPLCSGNTQCSYTDFKNLVNQANNGFTTDDYQRDCLGRSLPELQTLFQRAGFAFQAQESGASQNIANIRNELTGRDSNNAESVNGSGNESAENGEDSGFFSSTLNNARQGVNSDVESARQSVTSDVESARQRLNGFLGRH